MADQQHGAFVLAQHVLQQVQRFQIEVVGRLVEDHQVRRLGQRHREHEAAALAAGEHAHGGARLLRPEQEILHVADDMAHLAVDRDLVTAAAGQRFGQRACRIEAGAGLIQRDDFQIGADADFPRVRRQRAGQHAQQRGLAPRHWRR